MPPAQEGLRGRFWTADAGPHLDPLQWEGPADAVTGFPLPVADAPDTAAVVDTAAPSDSSFGAGAARYAIFDGWVWLPANVTHLKDNNANTGELGMVLMGSCCGGALKEQPGGNHTANTSGADRALMDSVSVAGGWHYIYSPQSDASAFQGLQLQYSTNNEQSWVTIGSAASEAYVQPNKPVIAAREVLLCEPLTAEEIAGGWTCDPLQQCCQPTYAGGDAASDGSRPLCEAQAPAETGLTYLAPQIHRRGYNGVSEEAARCDVIGELARIDPTPLTPELIFTGVGELEQVIVLDRWSDQTWIEYAWRTLMTQDPGTGWGFITVPNIAGFQRPIITVEGTYRTNSNAVQEDGSGNTNNESTEGASPRGPYMGQEAHHWSSTQRVYAGFFRRDNPVRMFVEFRAKYTCL
jgi:hypothetical protein